MVELDNILTKLCISNKANSCILISGDFNFPDISWSDSTGTVNSSPAYGYEVNQMFLDVIQDHGLDQLVTEATRGNKLDTLLTSTHYQ